jgi:hypothetical protein
METVETDVRCGQSWTDFLTRYRLTDIRTTKRGWDVESASGHTYHVSESTRLDAMGSMYFTMACDCPARKRCRHIDAVVAMMATEEGADGDMEHVERI